MRVWTTFPETIKICCFAKLNWMISLLFHCIFIYSDYRPSKHVNLYTGMTEPWCSSTEKGFSFCLHDLWDQRFVPCHKPICKDMQTCMHALRKRNLDNRVVFCFRFLTPSDQMVSALLMGFNLSCISWKAKCLVCIIINMMTLPHPSFHPGKWKHRRERERGGWGRETTERDNNL